MNNTFTKPERINSKSLIDKLFAGSNPSMAMFPVRVVFMKVEKGHFGKDIPAAILISVPKKRFHHAVDRNRVKRLVRESYRTQKHQLWDYLKDKDYDVAIAYVCITDQLPSFRKVHKTVGKSLARIIEKLDIE